MGWTIYGAEEAFIWLDRNGNGIVDDGSELFGNFTPLLSGGIAENGFEALREFDANGDGVIDANDPVWNRLMLWIDRDHNGFTTPDEIEPISARLLSIDLAYRRSGHRDQHGNLFRYESTVRLRTPVGDRTVPIFDVFFARFRPQP
jgi:hypothetical protein